MSVQKTLEVLRTRKLMGLDEVIAENYDVSDEIEEITETEWSNLPKEMKAIVEDKKHVLTYSYGDSSFKLHPITVNNKDKDVADLADPEDYEKDGGDPKKTNKQMVDNDKLNEAPHNYTYQEEKDGTYTIRLAENENDIVGTAKNKQEALKKIDVLNDELNEISYFSQEDNEKPKPGEYDKERRDVADAVLKHKRADKWKLASDEDEKYHIEDTEADDARKKIADREKQKNTADELLKKSKLSSATFESYQNRQEFDNDEDADVYFGHKHPRNTTVELPSEIKTKIDDNIKRIKDYMQDNEYKEFKDGEKAIDAMRRIEDELSSGDYEGFLKAQTFFQTLMGPIVDFFPAELVTFLSTGHQNQDGDSGFNKEVEPYETELPTNNTLPFQSKTPDERLSESYMFTKQEKFNQFFIDEILPDVVKKYGFDDKPAINQAYNDTLDSYEKDNMLPSNSRNWTLPDKVVDNPSNYITESTRIIVEYGNNKFDESNTAVDTWFERDRQYVGLYPIDDEGKPDTNKNAIIEWWDDDVSEAIEDGFLDPRDWHSSALNYAKHLGIIKESKRINIREAMKRKNKKSANPCWPGYEQVGMRKGIKGKKEVPNCVPKEQLKEVDEYNVYYNNKLLGNTLSKDPVSAARSLVHSKLYQHKGRDAAADAQKNIYNKLKTEDDFKKFGIKVTKKES